ncbi:hypothetical protein [Acinetobacter baumannii]|uniref:hypothetical protein n=1 Tax=Acinetobacter baumannii TaxID=470 RepID=UPI00366BC1F3
MDQACAVMGVYPIIGCLDKIIEEKVLLRSASGRPCIVMGHFHNVCEDIKLKFLTRIVPTKEYQHELQFSAEVHFEDKESMYYCAPQNAAQAVVQVLQGVNPDFVFSEW